MKIENSPSSLIDEYTSYQSIKSVRKALIDSGYSWQIFEDSKLPDNDRRPPFNIFTILVKNYKSIDHSGELRLTFFNNRLMSTWFYPVDLNGYLLSLKSKKNIDLSGSDEVKFSTFTSVWKHEDFENRMYVGWVDTRLRDESNRWISKYS